MFFTLFISLLLRDMSVTGDTWVLALDVALILLQLGPAVLLGFFFTVQQAVFTPRELLEEKYANALSMYKDEKEKCADALSMFEDEKNKYRELLRTLTTASHPPSDASAASYLSVHSDDSGGGYTRYIPARDHLPGGNDDIPVPSAMPAVQAVSGDSRFAPW